MAEAHCVRDEREYPLHRLIELDWVKSSDVYGVRTAPRSGFFILKSRGAERISAHGKSHGLLRSGFRRYKFHGLVRSGYPPLKTSPSGADFFECVTERISACGESHGLPRSGYPPLQMSRIIAEWISVARFFSRSGLFHSVEHTAQNRGISPRCTVAILRQNDT